MKKLLVLSIILFPSLVINGQSGSSPSIKAFASDGTVRMDGQLAEELWSQAEEIDGLHMVEPVENGKPSFNTAVGVIVTAKNLYFGISCEDSDPEGIVAFSKARDSELENEDFLKVILDTYGDGRGGYIFAINPFAARYDALVSRNGELENPNWDAAWDAATQITDKGWDAEIRIPISSLTYNQSLDSWGFNVERRIQRLLEVNRWSGISMDYTIGQTIHAGLITDLPGFNPGIGLTPRASLVGKATQDGSSPASYKLKPSLDLTQKITSDITAQLTLNTDFAETEVDSRQTNLTRFALLYPEKRQFFLEGADIYDFGISLGHSLMPFYSRRIGLYEEKEVPIQAGGKINGKVGKIHFGSLVTRTASVDTLAPVTTMGVVRITQNVLKESNFGMIATMGDPGGRSGAWTAGMDFTYQTSTWGSGKNFLVGGFVMMNEREGLSGDKTAMGFKIDYPNDLWDWFVQYRRVGDVFDPSMGFSARKAFVSYTGKMDFMPRPDSRIVRQHKFQFMPSLSTDLDNNWESYSVFLAPLNARLESGDRVEFNLNP